MGDENRIYRDRASRSRSKTPFLRSSCDRELCKSTGGLVHSHQLQVQYQKSFTAVAESRDDEKKRTFSLKYSDTVFGTASVTGGVKFPRKGKSGYIESANSQKKLANLRQINGVYRNSKERDGTSTTVRTVSRDLTDDRTSDYSSEGENIQEVHKVFRLYKDTGDWWNAFPKTDYTYSEYSTHRREIAPGIVNMPNMSRLGLRSQDSPSPMNEYAQQNLNNVGASTFNRSRYSSTYSRSGGNLRDEKWARVLGAEYASNQNIRQDRSFFNTTRTNITKIFTSVYFYVFYVIFWFKRSISSVWSRNYHPERRYASTSTSNFRVKLLHWIYRLLGFAQFADAWILREWRFFDSNANNHANVNRSRSLWSKLLKVFLLFSPLLLVAGCWAYIQICGDQGVSNSVSIPDPNHPSTTSYTKIASDTVIQDPANQDFGRYSILKILTGSMTSSLEAFWTCITYPWVILNQTHKAVQTNSETQIPIARVDSTEKVNVIVGGGCSSKVDIDDLASKLLANKLFLNMLSATAIEPVGAKIKMETDSILSKVNQLQLHQQDLQSQIVSQLAAMENMVRAEVAKVDERIYKMDDEQRSHWKKIVMDLDGVVTQTIFLKSLIQEENLRESSILGSIEDLQKWKEQQSSSMSSHTVRDFSELKVKQIVNDALMLYDADKTGRADFALESSGGSIISTRCTETYHAKTAVLGWFQYNLWYLTNNARTIIQPSVNPGECWAFKGSQGYVVIKLSHKIHVSMFTLEHIPKVLSPVGTIDSAPKNFSVWGLDYETDTEGQLIGQFVFDQNGSSLQHFPVEKPDLPPYQFIELRIESNYGNLEYTCVYRFRVHGDVFKEQNKD